MLSLVVIVAPARNRVPLCGTSSPKVISYSLPVSLIHYFYVKFIATRNHESLILIVQLYFNQPLFDFITD